MSFSHASSRGTAAPQGKNAPAPRLPEAPDRLIQPPQRPIGNQAMLRLLRQGAVRGERGVIQAKLAVGTPGDPLEREAEAAADHVMHSSASTPPPIGRADSEPAMVSASTAGPEAGAEAPAIVDEVLRASGHPLDAAARAYFETRFGRDFGAVRIHTGPRAAASADALAAQAYTAGPHVVFSDGSYQPGTESGRRLLAHELTHVAQRGGDGVIRRQPSGMDPRHARGHAGEQGMGFGYRTEKNWIFIEGPSGAAGHGVTAPGFDGVAYNIDADELHILDNKSLKATTARSATALTDNLLTNLDNTITHVRNMQDLPRRIRILGMLTRTRAAVAQGTQLPKNVKLVVTGEGGRTVRVGTALSRQGVIFQEPGQVEEPLAPTSPPAQEVHGEIDTSAPKGTPSPGAGGEGAQPAEGEPGPKPTGAPPVGEEPGSVRGGGGTPGVTGGPGPEAPSAPATPSVSARDIAAELAETERTVRYLEAAASLVRATLAVEQFVGLLKEALRAYAMAAATLAEGSPYAKEVRHASAIADRAKELADYYASLDPLRDMPRKGSEAYDSWDRLQQIQFTYLAVESKLHDTLESVKDAQRDLADQVNDLNDALTEKAIHATFLPYTSLAVADMYFYAEAGGKMRSSLIDADASYKKAQTLIGNIDSMTEGIIKIIELRLRELGVQGQVFAGMSDEEVRSTSYSKFNFRDAGD